MFRSGLSEVTLPKVNTELKATNHTGMAASLKLQNHIEVETLTKGNCMKTNIKKDRRLQLKVKVSAFVACAGLVFITGTGLT